MGFFEWVAENIEYTRTHGVYGLKNAYHELLKGGLMRIGTVWNFGEDIHKEHWDALIVLDACRADLLESVVEEYDFLENADDYHISNASASDEWIAKNLKSRRDQTNDICYISANPYDKTVRDEDFAVIERVWQDGWEETIRTTPPRAVTERAITVHRDNPDKRLLVHYMQPHAPYIQTGRQAPFMDVKLGEISDEQLWREYQDNLRYVLDDVDLLLQNVDTEKTIITADHGEALNDFGVYGHRNHVPVTGLKKVPWCVTTATDTGSYRPNEHTNQQADSTTLEEKLEYLGYR